jgi:hypothetical protein
MFDSTNASDDPAQVAEIERRRRHVQAAIANGRIEGICLNDPVLDEICEAYIRGEIDARDLVAVYQRRSQ